MTTDTKSNEKRVSMGNDKWSKFLVIMTVFAIALVVNMFNMVFHPELNNKHLTMISLRYCFLHLDDGFGTIVSATQTYTGRKFDQFD